MQNRTITTCLVITLSLITAILFSDEIFAQKKTEKKAKKKLYISTIKARGVNVQYADRVKNGIRLGIFENFGTHYQVLDDDAIKVMYKHTEAIIASGCNDESCMTQIANGINADAIIYGNVSPEATKISINIICLERKNFVPCAKSIVKISFFENQLEHFVSEATKKLMDPRYIITKDIDESFEGKIPLKGIEVEKIKDIGSQEESGFSIKVFKFTTKDKAVVNILSSLKNVVKNGDDDFQKGSYEKAAEKYNTVLDKIQSNLMPESQKRLKDFISEVKKRVNTSYKMSFMRDIVKGDDDFQKGEYESARKGYNGVLERINGLPSEFQGEVDDILGKIRKRIESTYIMKYKKDIEEIDTKFNGKESADEAFLAGLIIKYHDIGNDFAEVPKDIYGDGMTSLQNALNDRKDSLVSAIVALHEKNGDKEYENHKFVRAIEYYSTGHEMSQQIGDEKIKEEATGQFAKRIAKTLKTGKGYIENRMKSLADLAEFYQVDKKTSQAKSVMKEAKNLITGPMRIFPTPAALETYNRQAVLMEIKPITRESEPKVYATIDKMKSEEKRIIEEKERFEHKKRVRVEREVKLAELKKKGFVAKKIGGIMFMKIPGGSFIMGSPDNKRGSGEHPHHRVTIGTFYMGVYEVTQKQYRDIMGENPSIFEGDDLPVEQISYNHAMEFCKKFSKRYKVKARLPFEAEWEYACRAGTTTKYYWGDEINEDYCWYTGNSAGKTHPVGQKLPNAWGLYDMSGNVWEWCADWYDENYYKYSPKKNPNGPRNGSLRVLRGGSWLNHGDHVRSAVRLRFTPTPMVSNGGLRIALFFP